MNLVSRVRKIGIIGGGIGGLFLTSSIVRFWDNYPDIYIFAPRFDERGPARTSRTSTCATTVMNDSCVDKVHGHGKKDEDCFAVAPNKRTGNDLKCLA